MKTYKEFNEAAALAIPALKAAGYVIPALGGIVKGVSAITNRETGLSDSERRRVGELMDMIKRKKEREKTQQTEKEILDYGRKKEGIAARPKVEEQLVVPRGIKRKYPFGMPLEKEKQILRTFSNRPSVFNRAVTGQKIPGVSEQLTPEQKKDAKLNYQYKEVTNPKPVKPLDVLKSKKGLV